MKYRYLRAFLLVSLGLVLVSCSITRVKWRIKWDKDLEKSKAAFMGAPLQVEKERQPNIILLVADDPRSVRSERLRRRAHLDPEHRSDR